MKTIFALFDKVAGVYRVPMFAPNAGVMVRDLRDELNRVDRANVIGNHPDDFCLREFGTWDDETGAFCLVEPRLVVECSVLVDRGVENSDVR